MNKLDLLKPKVKELAEQLIARYEKESGNILHVTDSFRTVERQAALYAQGRITPGNIVTNARGGYSSHNYRVAFDVVPVIGISPAWNDLKAFEEIGKIGVKLGLEWGGNWSSFPDRPHFQYLAGYTLEDFRAGRINEQRFASGQAGLYAWIKELQAIVAKLLKRKK
jgi:peptidoglycan L-alanyl-D-glutamate endopeptidase CwlK